MKLRREKHTEGAKYLVQVMWLAGHTQQVIAHRMLMRKKQVAGIIDASEFANRSAMTDKQRKEKLHALLVARPADVDDGIYHLVQTIADNMLPVTGRKRRA